MTLLTARSVRAVFGDSTAILARDTIAAGAELNEMVRALKRLKGDSSADEKCWNCGGDGYEYCNLGHSHECSECHGYGSVAGRNDGLPIPAVVELWNLAEIRKAATPIRERCAHLGLLTEAR